jgi:hypothetical protein
MLSAFANESKLTVVIINYTSSATTIELKIPGVKKAKQLKRYNTSAERGDDMKPSSIESINKVDLLPRSITTLVIDL